MAGEGRAEPGITIAVNVRDEEVIADLPRTLVVSTMYLLAYSQTVRERLDSITWETVVTS